MIREFSDGSEILTRAAVAAGCNFYAGYPISPSTRIHNNMMMEIPASGGTAIQGEDEISSISLCIAASMAGRKALTSTSGPGMSLYSESIGLAVMGEVPLVIVDVQRLGPATGGATTGSEGDLQFVRWCAPGGIPMVVLSPSSLVSLHRLTIFAFNISEELRIPVILLSSKEMMMSKQTFETVEMETPPIINRRYHRGEGEFIPYPVSDSGEAPGFLPIGAGKKVRFTTSMHDEKGYITKDREKTRERIRHLREKISVNRERFASFRENFQEGSENLIITYGITSSAAVSAVEIIRNRGGKCSLLIIESLFPEPIEAIRKSLRGVKRVILPELNTGLYAETVSRYLSPDQELIPVDRTDGGMLTPGQILQEGFPR